MIKEKVKIRNLELKNRLVMPPVATYKCTEEGKVTDDLLDYYSARAEGGNIGLITIEHSYISQQGKANKKQLSISDDSDVEGLSKLVETVHQNGSKVFAQLNHAGSAAVSSVTGLDVVSSSSVILPTATNAEGELPRELTQEEIKNIIEAFTRAAARAKAAGFDGVEIHSAHFYLLNQFYSPLTNKRTDEYGGALENRIRIHREVIKAVRNEVGEDFTISLRLGCCDYTDGGSTLEDAVYAAKTFAEDGIDIISVSGGMYRYTRPGHDEPGYYSDVSTAIRNAINDAGINAAVLLAGGIKTIEDADRLLKEGAADLIGVGRELLKDANWADKELGDYGRKHA